MGLPQMATLSTLFRSMSSIFISLLDVSISSLCAMS